MKGTKICLSMMFLYVTIDCTARTVWTKGNPVKFETTIADPSKVVSLSLTCEPQQIAAFNTKAELFTDLKEIQLTASDKKTDWNTIFLALNRIPSLRSVEFSSNGFARIPDGISTLKNINSLSISDNDKMDLEDLAAKLADMENIKELKLEVFGLNNLPENISDIDGLEKLSIYNKKIIFGNEATKDQAEEQLRSESDFTITWYNDLNERKEAAISYFALGTSITGDDMYSISKLFPRTDLSSYAENNKTKQRETLVMEQTPWVKKYNFVKPPIAGVDVEKKYYQISAVNGGNFTYSSGSTITIPPNAFITASGKPVTGDVTIDYREFKDQADILASGIPMTYDSGGVQNVFESAGMLEINASKNGEELFLKEDKKIDLDFTSNDDRSVMNLYAFNDTTGSWKILGKAGRIQKMNTPDPKILSAAYIVYRNSLSYGSRMVYDSTDFAGRFESNGYCFTEKRKSKEIKNNTARKIFITHDKSSTWLIKPSVMKRLKDGKVMFTLKYFSAKHPELNTFSNFKWVTDENMTSADFRKQFNPKKRYTDIRIVREGDSYLMQFKGLAGVEQVTVRPMWYNSKFKKVTELTDGGAKRYKYYSRLLRSRERFFNRALKKGHLEDNRFKVVEPEDLKMYAWQSAKSKMSNDELAMNMNECIKYFEKIESSDWKNTMAKYEQEQNILRSFSVNGMGIYNCDQIQRISQPIQLTAIYFKNNDSLFSAKTSYVIDKHKNSVFCYSGPNIIFGRKATNVMLTVAFDGTVTIFTADQFSNETFRDNEQHNFKMTAVDTKVNSVGDLRKLMALK